MNLLVIISLFTSISIAETKTSIDSKTRISAPNELHSGCDLYVTGVDSKAEFLKFFKDLKLASASRDPDQMVKLINFPMSFNPGKRKLIKDEKDFKRKFSTIFTQKIFEMISKQEVDQLFCRDQGVMFGSGELWIGVVGKKIGIKSINQF
jgi:hypothetical protein